MSSIVVRHHPPVLGSALSRYPDLRSAALDKVRVRVLSGVGLNCEAEGAAAFEMLGVPASVVHVQELLEDPENLLQQTEILVFSGGFSFGDHLAAGRVLAHRIRSTIEGPMARYVDRGGLALGMCNGFQVMVKMGLLPGLGRPAGHLAEQQVSLVSNANAGYRNAWVQLQVDADGPCVFTRGLQTLACPSRHAEGRLVFANPEQLATMQAQGMAPVRYAQTGPELGPTDEVATSWPSNPNGSPSSIAGLCDPSGRIFGLMPHPEAFLYPENHPHWRRARRGGTVPSGAGLDIFANAVRAALR